jgi:predicted transcriptional regulator
LGAIQEILDAEILIGDAKKDVNRVMASDLMSDVLSFCCSGALLVTGLTNHQTIRTAEVVELPAVVFARGKQPSEEAIDLAKKRDITLILTSLPVFEVCGLLYSHGLTSI